DRFRLSQLDSVWNRGEEMARVLNAHDAQVDARMDLTYGDGKLDFGGAFHLSGLTLAHPRLAPVPVPAIAFSAGARGQLDVQKRSLALAEAAVDFRNLHAVLTADVANLGKRPRFSATLKVGPLACQVAL